LQEDLLRRRIGRRIAARHAQQRWSLHGIEFDAAESLAIGVAQFDLHDEKDTSELSDRGSAGRIGVASPVSSPVVTPAADPSPPGRRAGTATDPSAPASTGAADHDWLHALRGRFLVFDGPDGSGKSTQMARFIAHCREHAVSVTDVREPGGTPIGEEIRRVLLDPANGEMTVHCEMLLYMASRAQLVSERIEPALQRGELVLSDRFVSSTLAYQGTAGGLSEAEIRAVAEVAVRGRMPDLVVIFDVDEITSARRLSPLLDRMEQKGLDFHKRVRRGYLMQAERDPRRHLVVDASREPDAVWTQLVEGLRHWCSAARASSENHSR